MLNHLIKLHDSVIENISCLNDTIILTFSGFLVVEGIFCEI
jgi:hypothetical protein